MNKQNSKRKIVALLLCIIILILLIVCAILLSQASRERREDLAIDAQRFEKRFIGSATPAPLSSREPVIVQPKYEPSEAAETTPQSPSAVQATQKSEPPNLLDFTNLKAINSEVCAWITIDGTAIDYAVVQSPDNEYYLTHDYKRSNNKNGAIFMDYRNNADFSDFNTILYGHHMKSGRMFQNLELYKDEAFFNAHRTGKLYTPGKTYKLTVFAVALTEPNSAYYNYVFVSVTERENHIAMICDTTVYYRGDIAAEQLLTLSTCTYEYQDARTVLLLQVEQPED